MADAPSLLETSQKLQQLLETITPNVYHQPPSNVAMQYPCIKFETEQADVAHADNVKYRRHQRYQVTIIDWDPDSSLFDQVDSLQWCQHDRSFAVNDLNHHVFTLYF
jgi:hypothetical protein